MLRRPPALSTVWNIVLAAVLVAAAFERHHPRECRVARGANIRFGAAVQGSAPVASVIGRHVRTIGFDDGGTLLMRM